MLINTVALVGMLFLLRQLRQYKLLISKLLYVKRELVTLNPSLNPVHGTEAHLIKFCKCALKLYHNLTCGVLGLYLFHGLGCLVQGKGMAHRYVQIPGFCDLAQLV